MILRPRPVHVPDTTQYGPVRYELPLPGGGVIHADWHPPGDPAADLARLADVACCAGCAESGGSCHGDGPALGSILGFSTSGDCRDAHAIVVAMRALYDSLSGAGLNVSRWSPIVVSIERALDEVMPFYLAQGVPGQCDAAVAVGRQANAVRAQLAAAGGVTLDTVDPSGVGDAGEFWDKYGSTIMVGLVTTVLGAIVVKRLIP